MLCAPTPAAPTPADTARQNGALSKGPTTPAGKARSARNATRHGICARTMTPLDPEDAAALASFRAAMHARYKPVDEAEAHWVEELVFVAWRQRRLRVLEDAVLTRAEGEADSSLPSLATLIRYRGRLDRDWRRAGEELAALRQPRPAQAAPPAQADRRDDAHASPNGTNEPKAPTPSPPPTRTQVAATSRTNEPRHPVPPLPDLAADDPLPPLRPLNRHERRRLAALQRQAA